MDNETMMVPVNEFAVTKKTDTAQGMMAVAQQREIAEVQSKIILARRFPRDEKEALDRIIMACGRVRLAETATYEYRRGGTSITGPSIRLAETVAQAWGNVDFGVRELEQANGSSTVEAYAWDVQTNTSQRKIFQVPHIRHTKNGVTVLTDPRDIYELVANQGARRLRACILGIIPGDVVETAVAQCEETLRTKINVTPELIQSLIDKFNAFGVTKEQLEARIQRRMNSITPAGVVQLGKIYNSLKDGMSKPSEWFSAVKTQPEHGTIDIDAITGGTENRGHGDEALDAVKPEPKAKAAKKQNTIPFGGEPTAEELNALLEEVKSDTAEIQD